MAVQSALAICTVLIAESTPMEAPGAVYIGVSLLLVLVACLAVAFLSDVSLCQYQIRYLNGVVGFFLRRKKGSVTPSVEEA